MLVLLYRMLLVFKKWFGFFCLVYLFENFSNWMFFEKLFILVEVL